ncbi:MAG: AAA family ATPase, partial [Desulfuromonas sp.]
FKNTVIIMTSNLGSEFLLEDGGVEGEISAEARAQVQQRLRQHFRPEFLNRIDDIILFSPLTRSELDQIIDLQVAQVQQRLEERRIEIKLTDAVKEHICQRSYDPHYGARPVKRFLQQELETRIGRGIIAGDITEGSVVEITLEHDALALQVKKGVEAER